MKLINIELTSDNHFIAMEYYGWILNRTYLILLINDDLVGIVANGAVSTDSGIGLARIITTQFAISGDLYNPLAYIKEKYLIKAKDLNLANGCVKSVNKSNFRYHLSDITSVVHNPKRKWGMGPYPHNGRLYIEVNGVKREFILLGNQSGDQISNMLLNRKKGTNKPLKDGVKKLDAL